MTHIHGAGSQVRDYLAGIESIKKDTGSGGLFAGLMRRWF